jgi:hypothetical protein
MGGPASSFPSARGRRTDSITLAPLNESHSHIELEPIEELDYLVTAPENCAINSLRKPIIRTRFNI